MFRLPWRGARVRQFAPSQTVLAFLVAADFSQDDLAEEELTGVLGCFRAPASRSPAIGSSSRWSAVGWGSFSAPRTPCWDVGWHSSSSPWSFQPTRADHGCRRHAAPSPSSQDALDDEVLQDASFRQSMDRMQAATLQDRERLEREGVGTHL